VYRKGKQNGAVYLAYRKISQTPKVRASLWVGGSPAMVEWSIRKKQNADQSIDVIGA